MNKHLLLPLLFSGCTLIVNDILNRDDSDPDCGNNIINPNEECDDGNSEDGDGCSADCLLSFCGDGIVDSRPTIDLDGDGVPDDPEQCDDGNQDPGDACTSACKQAQCGDGFVQVGVEICDGGNIAAILSCDANCQPIPGQCGNGQLDPNEACDDGNQLNDDGCDNDCTPSSVIKIVTGSNHTCALTKSQRLRCWGDNSHGQLGYGHFFDIGASPNRSIKSAGNIKFAQPIFDVAAGSEHTCIITEEGAFCWGRNDTGQLGETQLSDTARPDPGKAIVLSGAPFEPIQIAAGEEHTCALFISDGGNQIRCWGANGSGQLGNDSSSDLVGQVPLNGDALAFGNLIPTQIEAGSFHTCALFGEQVRCWGRGAEGRLGNGDSSDIGDDANEMSSLTFFVGVGGGSLSLGGAHSCLANDAVLSCWGANGSGQLGNNSTDPLGDSPGDIPVPLPLVVQSLAAGDRHTCFVDSNEQLFCWGENSSGQLGEASTDDSLEKSATPALTNAIQVAAGAEHSCAIVSPGTVRCWGLSDDGQLGYNDTGTIGDDERLTEVADVPVF